MRSRPIFSRMAINSIWGDNPFQGMKYQLCHRFPVLAFSGAGRFGIAQMVKAVISRNGHR